MFLSVYGAGALLSRARNDRAEHADYRFFASACPVDLGCRFDGFRRVCPREGEVVSVGAEQTLDFVDAVVAQTGCLTGGLVLAGMAISHVFRNDIDQALSRRVASQEDNGQPVEPVLDLEIHEGGATLVSSRLHRDSLSRHADGLGDHIIVGPVVGDLQGRDAARVNSAATSISQASPICFDVNRRPADGATMFGLAGVEGVGSASMRNPNADDQ